MENPRLKTMGVWTLGILAVVQVSILVLRVTHPERVPLVWPQAGDTISTVRLHLSDGRRMLFPSGDSTVLLIFDSRCGHCENVAPEWSSWLRTQNHNWEVLAVSPENLETAAAFAEEQRWEVDVGVVEPGNSDVMAMALTGRTPWVFVANGAGVILVEGRGDLLPELIPNVETLATGDPRP